MGSASEKLTYKGTHIYVRPKSLYPICGFVNTAGTEEPLPKGVKIEEVKIVAKEFGVEVKGDEDEYWIQVKAKTGEDAERGVEKIKKFLDYSRKRWKINWW